MGHLTWLEAIVIGGMQGVAELLPVSSSILIPALVGGSWAQDLDVSAPESPYLAFVVGLHAATALALLVYFWRDWVRIIRAGHQHRASGVANADQRLAWLLVLATIPVRAAYCSSTSSASTSANPSRPLRRRADDRAQAAAPTGAAAPVITETVITATVITEGGGGRPASWPPASAGRVPR